MGPLLIIVAVVVVLMMVVGFVKSTIRRCSSNQVLVVYGAFTGTGRTAKTIHGGTAIVLPLLQDYRYLSLEPIQIEIRFARYRLKTFA